MTLDKEDEDVPKCYKDVLSFWGVQLQSHAAMILGLALLVFAVIQAWGQLPEEFRSNYYRAFSFSLILGSLGAGIVYQIRRLYVYGKLASAILYSTDKAFNDAKKEYRGAHPDYVWSDFTAILKITVYGQFRSEVTSVFWRKLRVFSVKKTGEGLHARFWVLGAAFLATFGTSFGLVFWKIDFQVLAELPVVLAIIIVSDIWWEEGLGKKLKEKLGLVKESAKFNAVKMKSTA